MGNIILPTNISKPAQSAKAAIKDVLFTCTTIESNLYALRKSVQEIDEKANKLKEVYSKKKEPVKPVLTSNVSNAISNIFINIITLISGSIYMILAGIFVIPIICVILLFGIMAIALLIFNADISVKTAFIIMLIIVGAIGGVALVITSVQAAKKGYAENEQIMKKYEQEYKEYEDEMYNIAITNNNTIAKRNALINLKKETQNTIDNVTQNLNQIYEKANIPSKYRKFPIIATLYEYFDCDRVDTLREAINLYEQELRLNTIISQIDDVLYSLDRIQDNQNTLYNEIVSAQNATNVFMSEISNKLSTNNSISQNILKECELNRFNTSLLLYSNEKLRESLSK